MTLSPLPSQERLDYRNLTESELRYMQQGFTRLAQDVRFTAHQVSKMTDSLGTVLASARRLRGKTQDDIARLLEVTRGAVAQYESGKITPSVGSLSKLCEYLQISVGEAIKGELKPLETQRDQGSSNCLSDDPEVAKLFKTLTDYVQGQVLFEPTPKQTLQWLGVKSGALNPQ